MKFMVHLADLKVVFWNAEFYGFIVNFVLLDYPECK